MSILKNIERIICNNCSSKITRVFLKNIEAVDNNETFNIEKCSKCGLVFLNPRPTQKVIGKYYSSESYWDKKIKADKAYGYLLNIIKNKIKSGKILDVGAATGSFLSNFNKKNWSVEGTDISKIASKIAESKYGINIKIGEFLDIKYPTNYFGLVTFNNVLEHLYKPKETLIKVYKVLKKGGTILITVPNIDSFGFKLFKQSWYALDAPRHLYHFNSKTLERMVIDSGFKVVKVRHGYFYHNFPVLFESFRRRFSPRIQMKGDVDYDNKSNLLKKNLTYQLFKNTVVVLSKVVFILIAIIEPVFKKGEVIVLEATK